MAEAPVAGGMDIRRLLLLAGVGVVISFASIFFLFKGCVPSLGGGDGYTVIYSDLDIRDAAKVVAQLKTLKIPYKIKDKGRAISVPKDQADGARLSLAEKKLPAGGVVGWEIFDESKLGATDFDRRIQLIRAISGELSRTIRRIDAVAEVRVQIVIPETRLFAATVAPVTASVMLRLKPGATLGAEKINGIVHLVASSVENLQPENVTVIDDSGRILTSKAAAKSVSVKGNKLVFLTTTTTMIPTTTMSAAVSGQATVELTSSAEAGSKEKLPLTAEERILLLLQAKKTMERDLAAQAQEIVNSFYPPNGVIVKINVDLYNVISEEKASNMKLEDLRIKKIATVILVDNRITLSKNLKDQTFKSVAAAIGYKRSRGDRILLQKVPFHLATPPPVVNMGQVKDSLPTNNDDKKPNLLFGWLKSLMWLGGFIVIVFILVYLFRLRRTREKEAELAPVVRQRASSGQSQGRGTGSTMEQIKSMASDNPEKIAALLRSWLTKE